MSKLQQQFPDIIWHKLRNPAEFAEYNYDGFNPSIQTLPKGHTRKPGRRAFDVDTLFEKDVAVKMRDGVTLYTDIFRPASSNDQSHKVPAIIPWSPYGKTGRGVWTYDNIAPFRVGLPLDRTSGYEKFEAPDPADWCGRGYAVVNVDSRGAGDSEDNIIYYGQQEAEDIYDFVDWVSRQPWCNGSIAFAGNSWLAIAAINFASRFSHPAVKALAPWEGTTDFYRQLLVRGGVPRYKFMEGHVRQFAGHNYVENIAAMARTRPHYDEYWEEKSVQVENINTPLYLTASYSTGLHCEGSFHTFRKAGTKEKWLRVHCTQEWYDLYRPESSDDLERFFDHYCKNVDNGWEKTPRLRLSLLGFCGSPAETIVERPEEAWPIPRTKERKYYLNLDAGEKQLTLFPPQQKASSSYDAHSLSDTLDFTVSFNEYTELAGNPVVKLWMSCKEKNDMDVTVQIRKIASDGRPLKWLNYPCPVPEEEVPDSNVTKALGPEGWLRASHSCSKEYVDGMPFYTSRRSEPIPAGTIVPLEIPIWPIGMVFEKGEGIMLRIAGHDLRLPEMEMFRVTEPVDDNIGKHVVHAGGEYNSYLILPVIS